MMPASPTPLLAGAYEWAFLPTRWTPDNWWPLLGFALAAALAVAALVATIAYRLGARAGVAQTLPGTAAPYDSERVGKTVPAPPTRQSADPSADFRNLVMGLIGVHDLAAGHPAIEAHVEQVLRRVGVHPIVCETGTTFDPATHEAVDTAPPEDGSDGGEVATTVRPGWSDGATLFRPVEVVVWTP